MHFTFKSLFLFNVENAEVDDSQLPKREGASMAGTVLLGNWKILSSLREVKGWSCIRASRCQLHAHSGASMNHFHVETALIVGFTERHV